MGDSLVPDGLWMGWKVFCSRSIWPRSSCMKVTSQMPSSTSRRPTSRGAATRPRRSHQAEAQPPDGELGEVEQGIGAGEGHAVVGAYGGGQPTFAEQMLEGGNGWIFPHGLERLAEQQVARGVDGDGDGERVAVLAVAEPGHARGRRDLVLAVEFTL
jgi:hypothetical protein